MLPFDPLLGRREASKEDFGQGPGSAAEVLSVLYKESQTMQFMKYDDQSRRQMHQESQGNNSRLGFFVSHGSSCMR